MTGYTRSDWRSIGLAGFTLVPLVLVVFFGVGASSPVMIAIVAGLAIIAWLYLALAAGFLLLNWRKVRLFTELRAVVSTRERI